mgnify:CR=1 FL=1
MVHGKSGDFGIGEQVTDEHCQEICDSYSVPRKTREPFELPKLIINDEFWNHEHQTIDGWIANMKTIGKGEGGLISYSNKEYKIDKDQNKINNLEIELFKNSQHIK